MKTIQPGSRVIIGSKKAKKHYYDTIQGMTATVVGPGMADDRWIVNVDRSQKLMTYNGWSVHVLDLIPYVSNNKESISHMKEELGI